MTIAFRHVGPFSRGLLALVVGGLLGACDQGKVGDPGFGAGGGTPAPGDQDGDGTGDTEDVSETVEGSCVPSARLGATFLDSLGNPLGVYDDWDYVAEEGTECVCELVVASDLRVDDVRGRMAGSAGVPAGSTEPFKAAIGSPWGVVKVDDPDRTEPDWWNLTKWWSPSDQRIDGTWDFILSKRTWEGGGASATFVTDCGDYGEVDTEVFATGTEATDSPPPPMPTGPGGAEDDAACTPGATATTRFRLADFPSRARQVPLGIAGAPRWHGARAKRIKVVNWRGADELRVVRGPQQIVLTPASPEVVLTGPEDWWLGSVDWKPARTAGDDAVWRNPEVEVEHACPSSPVGGTVPTPPGYGLSTGELRAAVQGATGLPGAAALLLATPGDDRPVYAARISPAVDPVPGVESHTLWLEVRGTRARAGFPLLETGPGAWSVSLSEPGFALSGTVSDVGGDLTLSVQSGTLFTHAGDVSLDPTTLVLTAL